MIFRMISALVFCVALLVSAGMVAVSAADDDFYGPVPGQGDLPVNSPIDPSECCCTSFAGTWFVQLDTNCDSIPDINRTFVLAPDFTWTSPGFPNGGPWSQIGCNVEMTDTYLSPPVIWTGTFHDGQWSGTYSGLYSGCFTGTPDFIVEIDCSGPSPTEDETWGRVKLLYR